MRCRKNVKSLGVDEKRRFIEAIKWLKTRPSVLGLASRYDDYVEVHRGALDSATNFDPGWAHNHAAFFPWHRELLYQFEEEVRTPQSPNQPAFDENFTIPYWDWTREQSSSDDGFPFQHDFIGVDGAGNPGNQVMRDPAHATEDPYFYPFDPDDWTIVVKDGGPGDAILGTDADFLTRYFGFLTPANALSIFGTAAAVATELPQNDTAVAGTNTFFRQVIGAANYLQLRALTEDLHNLVHRYVYGNFVTSSSPNDPVFWMHHAQIDRMWTIWQERPPLKDPHYQPGVGADFHGIDEDLVYNEPGAPPPWDGAVTPNDLLDSHAMHGDSIWYESDLPEITLETGPTLDFGPVPQGLTQYRAVRFRIATCRPLRFRITGAPTGNFGTPAGTEFMVQPDLAADFVDGLVWVEFVANGSGHQTGSVTIEAYLIDEEGYYAATEGGEFILMDAAGNDATYTVDLSADVMPQEDNAVVLVLDRSGSMASPAGGGNTRSSLLKSAVNVFHILLRPSEEIGIVSFDDVTETPLPLTTQGAGLGTTLTGTSLDPRGLTAIGLGILDGTTMLAGATHTNKSLLVLTDGNQNVTPYVEDLPAGTITDRVYAIGFGLPGQVSDAVLNQITQNTGGDLIITGTLSSDFEQFMLTKYFVQVLAGVTSTNVVIDPQGELAWGSKHEIPFEIADTDVSIDIIALSPVPGLMDFRVITPSGQVLDPSVAASEPNAAFKATDQVAFYRLQLPAVAADAAGSHAGTWRAVLSLKDPNDIKKWLAGFHVPRQQFEGILRRETLPYSCIVHARSNLEFRASLQQSSLEPGTVLHVSASLTEYAVPFGGDAAVWGELMRPDGSQTAVNLDAVEAGRYAADVTAAVPGIYKLRVRAQGQTSGGHPFVREKTLTASVFAGGDRPTRRPDDLVDLLRERDERLCHLLHCLLSEGVMDQRMLKRLKELGIDVEAMRKCLDDYCKPLSDHRSHTEKPTTKALRVDPTVDLGKLVARRLLQVDIKALFRDADTSQPVADKVQKALAKRLKIREKPGAQSLREAGLAFISPDHFEVVLARRKGLKALKPAKKVKKRGKEAKKRGKEAKKRGKKE